MGLLLLLVGPYLKAQKSGIQSLWHGENINQLTILNYQQDKNIFYLVSNNQEYIYLNLVVPRSNDQKKILLLGLTVYVDPSGKSKKDLAIMYPYRWTGRRYRPDNPTESDSIDDRELPFWTGMDPRSTGDINRQGMRNPGARNLANFDLVKYSLAEMSRRIGLKGYTNTSDVIAIPSTNPLEVHGWIVFDSTGVLYYSLAIPFVKVPVKENMGKNGFSIGIETGFISQEAMMANRPGGGQPGGMGGRPGGGMGRSGGGARGGMGAGAQGGPGGGTSRNPAQMQAMMEQRQALSSPTKFWIKKISLSEKE